MLEQKEILRLCILTILLMAHSMSTRAQEACQPIAEIISAQGEIRINGAIIDNATASRNRLRVCAGDLISSGELSRASLAILTTDAILRIDQNTEFRINIERDKDRSLLDLIKGAINFLSPSPVDIGVRTAAVNAAVEGTEFHVRVEGDRAAVTVLEGQVRLTDSSGGNALSLQRDQAASARVGQPPTIDPSVNETNVGNAVQWAHFYPPIINLEKAAPGLTEKDAEFHVRRAAMALSRGGVAEAEAALRAATAIDPDNEDVWGLELIIELSQFDRTPAKTAALSRLLEEGESRELNSSAALVALSYVQQWHFDLDGALASLINADKVDPDNPVVIARLAELWLAMGDVDRALFEATRADNISFTARARTVLGYVYLAKIDVDAAAKAFEEAIGRRSDDPLPHLGLGLAKIRRGDLESGTDEIRAAYGLDQANALIRSYLGKAFFEQKRNPLDGDLYAEAKALDPNDPTPWFYNAIRLQTLNRPVEALQDVQASIEKNDNRAVYRSRLLLDEDLAARSAALARIFKDLGFGQKALVEGWTSVNADPSEHSGHRFLSDTYASLPRHEIARVSELLQSQLLQPINLTPIQPQLAETNLFILSGSGPSDVGFNEFNPLFTGDGVRLQFNAIGGQNGTLGNDLVVSGINGRLSYSLGQFYYETDGFRENNDQQRAIYNAFVQAALTHKTSIQAEIRSTSTDTGDVNLRFDPDQFSPDRRIENDFDTARFGLLHTFSPNSKFLASAQYGEEDYVLLEGFEIPGVVSGNLELGTNSDSWIVELQHHYHRGRMKLITGVGTYSRDSETVTTQTIDSPFPLTDSTVTDEDADQANLYAYALFDLSDSLILSTGISADFLETDLFEKDQVNPKFGITWSPAPGTTLRFAAFRALTRGLVAGQTIEPTQVAGFNQFFNDFEGDEGWRYGLAIDQDFTNSLFGGLEYARRDLESILVSLSDPPIVSRFDRDEEFARAYIYWTPFHHLALTAEYQYEQVDPEFSGEDAIIELTTQRLPLGVSGFWDNGWSAGLKATYIDQEGTFEAGLINVDGRDSFWVVDVSISYRLPNRLGILSVVAQNLLDEEFRFQDTDPRSPNIQSERALQARITLSF